MTHEERQANPANWDSRVALHVASALYALDDLVATRRHRIDAHILGEVGDVEVPDGRDWRLPGDPMPMTFSIRARAGV